jgi:hypothetical protein
MLDYIKIRTADLPKVRAIALEHGVILDRIYGGEGETVQVAGRQAGIRGNHEPTWTAQQRIEILNKLWQS